VYVGVLALQGDYREHLQALSEIGVAGRGVKLPADLEGISGLIIPGGESTTLGMLLESSDLRRPVSSLLESGIPVLGTCAGMILLASHVTDGRPDQKPFAAIDIDVRRNGYGRQLSSFESELDVAGFEKPLPAVFIRAPVVVRSGSSVEVLARLDSPRSGNALVAGAGDGPLVGRHDATPVLVRQGPVLAAAFHPELTPDRRLHQMFMEMLEKEGR
jgi:pyridoxal 5'-phosphate synthase pdxT subunit